MQRASVLFRLGEAALEQLTTWMETAYLRFYQLGIPLERVAWYTEDGPKGTRRLVCEEIVEPKPEEYVTVRMNGVETRVEGPQPTPYERLVELAGLQGNPSMIVDFADPERRPVAMHTGRVVSLADGDRVSVVHTGSS